jgi:hypothetical protein
MKVVRCRRAGARPVMMAARDGEQIDAATYAVVNLRPSAASLSRFGVR